MLKIITGALVFLAATIACILHIVAWTENRATHEVCSLIRQHYFRSGEERVRKFLDRCDRETTGLSFSKKTAIANINRRLSAIRSSHLQVFSPSENAWLWEHHGSDTGLRSRMIDSDLVVIRVLNESPADDAGIQPGDLIVTVNGESVSSPQEAQSTTGKFQFLRGDRFFERNLELADLEDDLKPTLRPLKKGIGLLTIPSFLPQYFEEKDWGLIAESLGTYRSLVIDLRDNPGGSFPAMLRALSPFRCEQRSIGALWRNGKSGDDASIEIANDLSAVSQITSLARSRALELKTFSDYKCFDGEILVLVDDGTSSVSEIFAHALLSSPRAKVWGAPTAGQVVMARWFSVGSLGGGDFAISIPIAGYRAKDGAEIESVGIIPQRELQYDLKKALVGEDSWVEEASLSFEE